jgi:2-polyprenyl-3-methyl-5-hydroxy-6-metoxy-1,4-benzoquinol methylase
VDQRSVINVPGDIMRPMALAAGCADRFYSNTGNAALLDLLRDTGGRTALDLGCGAGDNARLLANRGLQVTGVTLSHAEAEAAARWCHKVVVADLEQGIPWEAGTEFDLVIMSHVLEHIVNVGRLMNDVRRAIGGHGRLAVALPNVAHYSQRVKFIKGQFRYTPDGILDETHVRFYTFETAREMLHQNGFRIERAGAEGKLPWSVLRKVVPEATRCVLDTWACKQRPNLFGYNLVFLASRAADVP